MGKYGNARIVPKDYVDGYCAVNHWSKGWGWMYDEEAVRYWMPIEPPKEEVYG